MHQIEYKVIKSRKLSRGISLTIHPEKGVVVRAPFWVPDVAIRNFVRDKSDWIYTHLQKQSLNTAPSKNYSEGEKHLYFGKEYPLTFLEIDFPHRTQVEIMDENIKIKIFKGHLGEKRNEEIKDALLRFYLETGIGIITEKVNYYTAKMVQ